MGRMSRIEILDCTLRDGGYVNEWNFGESAIKAINTSLDAAGIDIVECGFLMEGVHNDNCSLFNSIEMVQRVIPKTRHKSMYVAMIATGKNEIDPSKISPNNGEAIDGIRLSFHIHEIEKALDWGEKIKEKGYKLFMHEVTPKS